MTSKMSEDDVVVKEFIFNVLRYILYILVIIFLVKRYYKSIVQRFTAWILNRFKGFVNKRALEQKLQLFTSLQDRKSTKRGGKLEMLEIGVGSGANFDFFPSGSEVICLEPNPHCKSYIEENAASNGIRLKSVMCGFAEKMKSAGLADNSFDAVVCTFVLCSVRDMNKVLSEVKRVLKPGGTFYFMEHIRHDNGTFSQRTQIFLNPVWRRLGDGCELIRDTPTKIRQSGFDMEVHNFKIRSFLVPFFVNKFCFGTATKVD